jgi:hypothetical protein
MAAEDSGKADAEAVLFKRLYGVKPDTFEKMLSILQKEYDALHRKGGKPSKLTVKDKPYIALKYLREYRTMDSIATEYGVCKGAVCLSIQWVEDGTFALPGKKAPYAENPGYNRAGQSENHRHTGSQRQRT